MTPNFKSLKDRMTPEELDLYQSFKKRIGRWTKPMHTHRMFSPVLEPGPITQFRINNWARINQDENPLWVNSRYAAGSRWGGIIAPPLLLLTVNDASAPSAFFVGKLYKPSPNAVLNIEKYPTFRGAMQVDTEWEFFLPVRPGDTVNARTRFTDIYWKQGKKFRLLFVFGETIYRNDSRKRVARCCAGAVYLFK